jgi:ABC-type Zn uptake system ZnuABC Zn-binding protein ZnuA
VRAPAAAAWLAALVLATGCGNKKVVECNGLVQVVNAGVQSVDKQPKPAEDPTGVAGLRALAEVMDRVAADAAKVPITVPELAKVSSDYQAMARDVARSAREMAAAADAKDVPKVSAAWAALEKAYNREEPLVDELNKLCQAP